MNVRIMIIVTLWIGINNTGIGASEHIILLQLRHIQCGRSAFSSTPPNIESFLWILQFPPVVTLDQYEMILTGPLGRTVLEQIELSSM